MKDQPHQSNDPSHPTLLESVHFWLHTRSSVELAAKLGVTSALLSYIRRGRRRLTPKLVIRIGKALEDAKA